MMYLAAIIYVVKRPNLCVSSQILCISSKKRGSDYIFPTNRGTSSILRFLIKRKKLPRFIWKEQSKKITFAFAYKWWL